MDGMHDIGGKQGFGRVRYSPEAKVFHEPWEVRANALYSLAVKLGIVNMDEYRYAIERMEPRHYLSASYYERSLTSVATLFVEKEIFTLHELEQTAQGAFPLSAPGVPGRTNLAMREEINLHDRVRVSSDFVAGHVRMPAYIRGKCGVVVGKSPAYPFPDAHAHGVEAENEPTFDVQFRSEDLWPHSSDSALVHVGVFHSYLEKVHVQF